MIRTRFAPSPTGYAHVGNIRTALFAYLTARHSNGKFIVRIEDTDKNREVDGAEDYILNAIKALGITYDEGPDIGGVYGPYKQSERLDIYKKWAQKLVDEGRAYVDPYTKEEIEAFKEQAKKEKKPYLYRNNRPENTPKWDGTQPLRFKSDPKDYKWHDEVMGDLSAGKEAIDDFIIIKSDGYPTYNFAHIVDDTEMKITHVIRGQEYISSMPNYLNLYEALGLERPIFAMMPHVLNETGNKKLGKRDGAKDVMEYLRDGYLPEALVNFIATLGWNDGTEQEIFSMQELIEKFTLDRVGKSGARFDEKRLIWMNGQWIKKLVLDDLHLRTLGSPIAANFWLRHGARANPERQREILSVIQSRLKTLADLPSLSEYFFKRPKPNWDMINDNKQLSKIMRDELINLLTTTVNKLQDTDWTIDQIQKSLNELLEETDSKPVILFGTIRFALTWAPFSPGLPEMMTLLGRKETISRLKDAIKHAKK
ncbi:glutamate--tRNA ligase [Ruminococcaceae bacterium OttesenSCG-928-A11]|nr:glutamate--tRNA ligase [Ruminococcaceae bacterium OttesenSCG-928-A11]